MKPRYQSALLPPGTRVQRWPGGQLGTVQQYQPQWSIGTFPVRWDDLWDGAGGVWETCGYNDVKVVPRVVRRSAVA